MVIRRFIKSLPKAVVRIQQIDVFQIEQYLWRLRDGGIKNRTLNARLTATVLHHFSQDWRQDITAKRVDLTYQSTVCVMFLSIAPDA